MRTRLRHCDYGCGTEKSFKTSEKFQEPDVVLTPVSCLYSDGESFHFMDEASFEQFSMTEEQLGDDRLYLKEGISLHVRKYNNNADIAAVTAVCGACGRFDGT